MQDILQGGVRWLPKPMDLDFGTAGGPRTAVRPTDGAPATRRRARAAGGVDLSTLTTRRSLLKESRQRSRQPGDPFVADPRPRGGPAPTPGTAPLLRALTGQAGPAASLSAAEVLTAPETGGTPAATARGFAGFIADLGPAADGRSEGRPEGAAAEPRGVLPRWLGSAVRRSPAARRAGAPGRPTDAGIPDAVVSDSLRIYLQEIGKVSLLTAEEEFELATRVRSGDRAAAVALTTANLRLVVSIARRYARPFSPGSDLRDLIQDGNLGLLRAVRGYDPNSGCRFSTYAYWWIRQGITRALSDTRRTIRLPVHAEVLLRRNRAAEERLQHQLRRPPTDAEVGVAVRLPADQVTWLRIISRDPVSLEVLGEDEERSLIERIPDMQVPDPADLVCRQALRQALDSVLARLTARQQEVLRLRYGLDDGRSRTLEEVGQMFGRTRRRIHQIEHAAYRLLRRPAAIQTLVDAR